jgi:hypothetical protein
MTYFRSTLATFAGLYMILYGTAMAVFGMEYTSLEVGIGVVAGGAWLLTMRDMLNRSWKDAFHYHPSSPCVERSNLPNTGSSNVNMR